MTSKLDKALAIVIASTRRRKRSVDLLTIAESFAILIDHYKSTQKVAKLTGISSEMVREFLKINELFDSTKELVRNRKIDSVDLAYRLTRLRSEDQDKIAKKVITNEMNTNDIRSLISYKTTYPSIDFEEIVKRIEKSRDRRVYVAYFKVPFLEANRTKSIKILKSRVKQLLGNENIEYLKIKGEIAKLGLNLKGLNRLREIKKVLKTSMEDTINLIITGKCSTENFWSIGAKE